MMIEVRNLFPSEHAEAICRDLGLKPDAPLEPVVGKGNYRIVGTEDRLEYRGSKVRVQHGYYSEHAERARRQAARGADEDSDEEMQISDRKQNRERYGDAGQKKFGRKTCFAED